MELRFDRCTLAFLLFLLLQACGGEESSATNGTARNVYGVAATGLAVNGTVTLRDATGNMLRAAISQPSGEFNIDVTGLTQPYFLRAADKTGTTTLYSVAITHGNFNINPLTNLAVVAAAMDIDPLAKTPDAAFNDPVKFSNLTPAQLQAAMDKVMAQMSPEFIAALAANGALNVSPLTDSFQVGNGLDKVFDKFVITLTATGEIQERQVVSNTTTVLGFVDILGPFSMPTGAGPVSCGSPSLATTPPAGTLIITANPVCKTYDGQPYGGGNGVTYNGFLNGDTPDVLGGTLTYGGNSQGAKNAGTYTITSGGLTSSSYNIIYVDSTLTISPVLLTPIAINTATRIYDGTTAAVGGLDGTGTVGFISGDNLTSSAGTPTATGLSAGTLTTTGSSAGNYSVAVGTMTPTITSATISQAPSGTISLAP